MKAVITHLNELIAQIQFDHEERSSNGIHDNLLLSIFDQNIVHKNVTIDLQSNFVISPFLINRLLEREQTAGDKSELISTSKKLYGKSEVEINVIREFEQNYLADRAIWWFTQVSSVFRLLNKVLRIQNMKILFQLPFIINDIWQQLKKYCSKTRIIVCRGQLMSISEFHMLRNYAGKFISINSFVLATMDFKKGSLYEHSCDRLERVLFEIEADPQLNPDKPFANIASCSFDKREEILFMLGSIFQIVKVCRSSDNTWTV